MWRVRGLSPLTFCMSVTLRGFARVHNRIKNADRKIRSESAKTLQNYGNKMAVYARNNHDFTSRTGQLENSIVAKVNVSALSMLFFINPDRVTNNGFNYAVAQHDGTRSGWKKSEFTTSSFTSQGGSGGIQYDHFMVRASEQYTEPMKRELRQVVWRALSGTN